jgi:hypothetical protein
MENQLEVSSISTSKSSTRTKQKYHMIQWVDPTRPPSWYWFPAEAPVLQSSLGLHDSTRVRIAFCQETSWIIVEEGYILLVSRTIKAQAREVTDGWPTILRTNNYALAQQWTCALGVLGSPRTGLIRCSKKDTDSRSLYPQLDNLAPEILSSLGHFLKLQKISGRWKIFLTQADFQIETCDYA